MSELKDLKQAMLEAGGEQGAAEQHKAGKKTARERVAALLDPESFVEVGLFASGVVTGFGTVEDRPVYVYAQDLTCRAGAMDAAQADKIVRVMDLAVKTGAPIVALLDSAGADLTEGVRALDAYARVMAKTAQVSGVVPQISVVAGPCAGGAALIPAMGDLVIAADTAEMFVSGPQVVSARTGKDISAKELGGSEALDKNGLAHLTAASEDEAIALARKIVSLLPANNEEDAPVVMQDDLNRQLDIDSYADAHDLLVRVADFNDYVELQKGCAKNMVVALARLGGRTVGLVANNPAENEGTLDEAACRKAARFVRMCDCFNIPVISFVNTKGAATVTACQSAGAIQGGAQLTGAYAEASVSKVCVICGDAIGSAYAAMGSRGLGADVVFAWPGAFIAPMDADAAVHVLNVDEIRQGQEVETLIQNYRKENDGVAAAKTGLVDDVIEPAATRQMAAAALEMLLGKRESALPKKHANLPL